MSSTRDRILAAAADLVAAEGWARVTMGRLAGVAEVSRQTVYNEVGSKPELAEAMVMAEVARFLAAVDGAFDAHPDDLTPAVHEAVLRVLSLAQDNLLLKAMVSATHGADTELLPLLTTHAGPLLDGAREMLSARLAGYPEAMALPVEHLETVTDVVVRTVLSHVMQPDDAPERTATRLAGLVGLLVRPEIDPA